jgi:uncharacterized protein (UPF0179 family)
VGHGEFHRRRQSQVSAKITFSQKTQRYIRRIEVIHPGIQAREISSHDVQLDLVESSGASGGAKVEFSAGTCALFGNPRREIEEAGQILKVRERIGQPRGRRL